MFTFALNELEEVFGYYKLVVDEECQFDNFQSILQKSSIKSLTKIFRYMEWKQDGHSLPKDKYRQLQPTQEVPDYEFKGDNIRVYNIDIEGFGIIILGGFKGNQKKDISKLREIKENFVEFLKTNDIQQIIQ